MKTGKIILGILTIIICFLVAGYYYLNWLSRQPCPPPEKPSIVPEQAIWKGACDGGNWIELIEIKENKFRFRVYRDWDGDLTLDADFKLEDCNNFKLTKTNWEVSIMSYLNESIDIAVEGENRYCRLIPIFPAYGGNEWEIIKEKEEY